METMTKQKQGVQNNGSKEMGLRVLDLRSTVFTIFIVMMVSYVLCILAGMTFSWSMMYKAWLPLLPGFVWPVTLGGLLIGVLWIIGYSVYLGALIVFPYNYFLKKRGL